MRLVSLEGKLVIRHMVWPIIWQLLIEMGDSGCPSSLKRFTSEKKKAWNFAEKPDIRKITRLAFNFVVDREVTANFHQNH